MKKFLLATSIFLSCQYFSQLSSTEINFNNYISPTDNDLKNNFISTNYYNLLQNGTNYYVSSPLQGTPTQPLTFCNKYKGIDTETMKISIDFKLDQYPTPPGNSDSVGIFLADNSNISILSVSIYNRQLYIGGLSNPSSTFAPTLSVSSYPNLHWYRLTFEITKIGIDKYSITSKVFRLGIDGTSTPTQIVKNTITGFNYNFRITDVVKVNLVGGYWGDVKYLDNFSIYGYKNGTNCNNLSTSENQPQKIKSYPNPTSQFLNIISGATKVEIYNLLGQKIEIFENPSSIIDIGNLKEGIYILKIYTQDNMWTEKITKK